MEKQSTIFTLNRISFLSVAVIVVVFLFSCHSDKSKDWPVYLGDKSSSHFTGLSQIDTNNVEHLKVAWIFHTGDADTGTHSQIQCNPLIIDGILYGTSPHLKLFSLDGVTGKARWVFDPFEDTTKVPVQINVNRGVTYWSDGADKRIFYAAGSFLYCLNALTGKLVISFGDKGRVNLHEGLGEDTQKLYVTTTSPGIIYKDLLIMGTRVAETNPAAPGDIRAYDVHTGKIKWVFHTIPHPGDPGYNTWENQNAWKYTGGGNCWAGMSLDEEQGIVFIPLGSAAFDFYGGLRKGEDLFTNCLVALDAANGELRWYYQTVHHDLWDRDLPAPPNLVRVKQNGRSIKAVAQVTKTGYIFLFNRKNGKPLFPVHETTVPDSPALPGEKPWPTQPIPQLPEPFVRQSFTAADVNDLIPDSSRAQVQKKLALLSPQTNIFLPPTERGTVIFPGFDGGAEWGGAAFDPATGWLFVNANQVPWSLTMVKSIRDKNSHDHTIADHGKAVYLQNCMTCHGKNKEGGGNYPSLQHINLKLSKEQVLDIINNGRRMMPAFKQITEEDKQALISFLLETKKSHRNFISSEKETDETDSLMPYSMTGYKKIRTPEGYPANKPPWGTLTAVNLNTGKHVWQIPLGTYPELMEKGFPVTGTENYGGPVVTAGGLLFIAATPDKKFRAFNKRTGKLLWETTLPAAGFATPSIYAINGKQYVVIACGGGKLDASSGDAYVAFALP